MDIRHLAEDELNVEFVLRNLDPAQVTSLDKLKKILADEAAGIRNKPERPNCEKGNTELQLCNKKLMQCMGDFETAKRETNRECLPVLFSRVLHLLGRFERLAIFAPNLDTKNSITQANDLLSKISTERPAISPNTSAVSFAGFSENDVNTNPLEELGAVGGNVASTAVTESRNPVPPANVRLVPHWPDIPTVAALTGNRDNRSQGVNASDFRNEPNPIRNAAAAMSFPERRQQNIIRDPIRPENVNRYDAINDPNIFDQAPPAGYPVHNNQQRFGLSQIISRWTVRFGGNRKDLPIDEFIFRVEYLAEADMIPLNSLVGCLHHLLVGSATDFYWILRRKYPNATWLQLKNSLKAHFAKHENDFEIRNLIMNRRQGAKEEFEDYCLAVECLAARLNRPMADDEIVEIMRENMSSRLQDRLLLVYTPTVDVLKATCKRFERLWASSTDRTKDHRFHAMVNEIDFPHDDLMNGRYNGGSSQMMTMPVEDDRHRLIPFELSALGQNLPVVGQPNEYVICWNCRDIGHTYVDCLANERRIFCFGCGESNVIKPRCARCNPGNVRAGGIMLRQTRPNPNMTNQARSNPNMSNHRQPNSN